MEQTIYFEDYEIGSVRESIGRTITETDIVIHAGQTGDFFPPPYGRGVRQDYGFWETYRTWDSDLLRGGGHDRESDQSGGIFLWV